MKVKNLAILFGVGTLSGVLAAIIVKDYINSKDSFENKHLYFNNKLFDTPKFESPFGNTFGGHFGNIKKSVSETENF